MRAALRLGTAGCLALTGYLHAELYVHGYRVIRVIGPSFLLLSAGAFALAVLLLVAMAVPEPPLLWLAVAGVAAGALAGFVLSRTVGLFGFVERGLQPAPQALLSILAETAILLLAGVGALVRRRRAAPA